MPQNDPRDLYQILTISLRVRYKSMESCKAWLISQIFITLLTFRLFFNGSDKLHLSTHFLRRYSCTSVSKWHVVQSYLKRITQSFNHPLRLRAFLFLLLPIFDDVQFCLSGLLRCKLPSIHLSEPCHAFPVQCRGIDRFNGLRKKLKPTIL